MRHKFENILAILWIVHGSSLASELGFFRRKFWISESFVLVNILIKYIWFQRKEKYAK